MNSIFSVLLDGKSMQAWHLKTSQVLSHHTFVVKNVKQLFVQLNKCGDILENKSSTAIFYK